MNTDELVAHFWPGQQVPHFEHAVALLSNDLKDTICHVGLTERTILIDELPVKVAGIGYVCTEEAYQGRGLMHKAMNLAHQIALDLDLDYALLNTGHVGLYEPMGYYRPPNLPYPWMVKALGEAAWPEDEHISLQGTW